MKHVLTCPKCSSEFEYEVTTMSGNAGGANLFKFSISVEHIDDDTDGNTNGELFKSLISLKEDESISLTSDENSEWKFKDYPKLNFVIDHTAKTQVHEFYLTCPKGHRRRYSISVEKK